ncbi:MAG: exodeoxyribonuclease VII small subunit [Christensenellales bacterium]|jgi:exodeoxyribonuclease VII small subunit
MSEQIESMGFEQGVKALEEVVRALEGGNLSLEESLRLYQQGVALAQRCERLLKDGRARVTALMADGTEQEVSLPDET